MIDRLTKPKAAPVGRPPTTLADLPDDWENICLECGREGGSDVKTRVLLGISDSAWYTLLKSSPEFSITIKKTKELSQVWWENAGQTMSVTGKGSAACWIFNMKNRTTWRDQSNLNHTSNDGSMSPLSDIKIEIVELKDVDKG